MSRRFSARFDGVCQHCDAEIIAGDEIAYLDDEIACVACLDKAGHTSNPLGDDPTHGSNQGWQYELPYMRGDDLRLRRPNYGRPKVILPDGKTTREYARVTKFIDAIDDKHNIELWKMRLVADGLSRQPELLLSVAAFRDDKRELDRLCDEARELAHQSKKSNLGKALHRLTEYIDFGLDVPEVPAHYRNDVEAYRQLVDKRKIRHEYIEAFMVNDDLKVGGSPDGLSYVDGNDRLCVVDKKTGSTSLEFSKAEMARQFVTYAHSLLYDCRTGEPIRTEIDIDTTRSYILYLPPQSGHAELLEIGPEDMERAWEHVQLCAQVRKARAKRKWANTVEVIDLGAPAEKVEPAPAEYHIDPIMDGIKKAHSVEALKIAFEVNRNTPDWRPEHLEAVKARVQEMRVAA